MRWLRRFIVLGAALGLTIVLVRRRADANDANIEHVVRPAGEDQWPPIAVEESPRWLAPIDGACPLTHPLKLNITSGIFHRPGGRFYERAIPQRCYADAADAVADGYRAAKA